MFPVPMRGDGPSYAITAGNTGYAFAIHAGTGRITVNDNRALDFETNPRFQLTVQVTFAAETSGSLGSRFTTYLLDHGVNPASIGKLPKRFATHTVIVNLNDVNEHPTLSDLSFRIDENSTSSTLLGTVKASDPDAGDTLSYTMTAGNTGDAFSIDAGTGQITVNNSRALDVETNPRFHMRVQVTDAAGISDSAPLAVNLNQLKENSTSAKQTPPVAEESNEGTQDVAVTVTDSDVDAVVPLWKSVQKSSFGIYYVAFGLVCVVLGAIFLFRRSKQHKQQTLATFEQDCLLLLDRIEELDGTCSQLRTENATLVARQQELVDEHQRDQLCSEATALYEPPEEFEDQHSHLYEFEADEESESYIEELERCQDESAEQEWQLVEAQPEQLDSQKTEAGTDGFTPDLQEDDRLHELRATLADMFRIPVATHDTSHPEEEDASHPEDEIGTDAAEVVSDHAGEADEADEADEHELVSSQAIPPENDNQAETKVSVETAVRDRVADAEAEVMESVSAFMD